MIYFLYIDIMLIFIMTIKTLKIFQVIQEKFLVPPPKEWTKVNLISERQGVSQKQLFAWSQVQKARPFLNENYVVLNHKIV
jgi:hypothetical protein